MAEAWSYKNLNLGGVQIASSGGIMPVGEHIMRIDKAEIKETAKGGHQLVVYLQNDQGKVRDYINLHVARQDERARTAERIGMERLKSIYFFGGHPDPDNAATQGVAGLEKMEVGVRVIPSKYTDKNGVERDGTAIRNSGAYFDPADVDPGRTSIGPISPPNEAKAAASDLDDSIPF